MYQLIFVIVVGATPGEDLSAAQSAIEDVQFEEAAALLKRVLAHPEVTVNQRIAAYRLLAPCQIAGGDDASAANSYLQLLDLDPNAEVETWRSPKVRRLFETARKKWRDSAPTIAFDPPSGGAKEVRLSGRAVDPRGVLHRVALFRREADQPFERKILSLTSERFELTTNFERRLEYFAIGLGRYDQILTQAGTRERPFTHTAVEPAATAEWYEAWWVWTIAGVVVAGGVAAAVLATRPDGTEDDTLFDIALP